MNWRTRIIEMRLKYRSVYIDINENFFSLLCVHGLEKNEGEDYIYCLVTGLQDISGINL